MPNHSIAVIVPARNCVPFIGPFFTAIKNQTFKDFSLYISCPTSTDNTLELIQKTVEENPDLHCVVKDVKNDTVGQAKNYWLDHGNLSEEYLAFIDIDDIPEPNFLEKLHQKAVESHADLISCGFRRYSSITGKTIAIEQVSNSDLIEGDLFNAPGLIFLHTANWNKLFRRSLVGQDVRFGEGSRFEDVVFVMNYLAKCSTFASVNEPLYNYRIGTNTLSSIPSKENLISSNSDAQNAMLSVREFYKKNKPDAYNNGFVDAVAFVRYGIGFTTRMCMSGQGKTRQIIRQSKLFLDHEFPQWRTTPYLSHRKMKKFQKKTIYISWCHHLYKRHLFPTFLICYFLFVKITGKEIKP